VAYTKGGDENDVLSRFAETERHFGARYWVRVTADCSFLAPDLAADVLAAVVDGADYACSRHDSAASGWPDGLDVEAFRRAWLWRANYHTADPREREDVTPWIRRNADIVAPSLACPVTWPDSVKLSIDCEADLGRARAIMAKIPWGAFGWADTYRAVRRASIF
jgi:spore coat polysaccharide biosynthesis protein SpsF (cytidylyltransferase family)